MMKAPIYLLILGMCASLMGCTYLENMFPDKEKDYQYTSETQLMNLPPELRRNKPADQSTDSSALQFGNADLSGSAGASGNDSNTSTAPSSVQENSATASAAGISSDPANTEAAPADENDEQDTVSSVDIVKYDDGDTRLRLGAKHGKSWRVVNKALSRNTIEVTERNHDQSAIKVRYDPNEKKAKDDSFMDEFDFIFKGIGINDRQFILKLEEHDEKTDVIVLDKEHLPMLNDNDAVRLLKVMADTIKADLAKKAKKDKEAAEQEGETPPAE